MKRKYHFTIRPNELNNERYIDIEDFIFKDITGDKEVSEYLFEMCGSDPYDMDKPDCDRIREHIQGCLWKALERAWTELEIEVSL